MSVNDLAIFVVAFLLVLTFSAIVGCVIGLVLSRNDRPSVRR